MTLGKGNSTVPFHLLALPFLALLLVTQTTWAKSPVWRERASVPVPRAGYMAGVINGKYVIAGGSYWVNKRKVWTNQVDEFDPGTNTWSKKTSLPEARSDAAVVSFDNSMYIFGGGANGKIRRDALRFYNNAWIPVPGAELPEPRLYSVATVCKGKIYLLGGLSKPEDYKSISNAFWVWDPHAPRRGWKVLAPLPGPGLITQAMTELNGRIFVLGGAKTGGVDVVNVKTAYSFDPASGKWTRLPDLPLKRRCWWGVPWNNKILLMGGYTKTYARNVFSYSPTTHLLSEFGDLPRGVCDAKFFAVGGSIVGTGGEVAPMVRGRWTVEARLPSASASH